MSRSQKHGRINKGQRQIIAEKISSTVRVLELLELEYEVSGPKQKREKGNRSPRVVYLKGALEPLSIYNSASGYTWVTGPDGKNIPGVKTVEALYAYLSKQKAPSD
jgi:hypothetical protein